MSNQVEMRTLFVRKRREIVEQIVKLEAKLAVYDDLLAELPDNVFPTYKGTGKAVTVEAAQPLAFEKPAKRTYSKRESRGPSATDAIELALEAAGDKGVTAREVAAVAGMPNGTASGRLSLMKAEGRVRHDPPRYFAVHSKHEDNNVDQGRGE